MQIGQRIQIEAFRTDGSRCRWWWVAAEIDDSGIRYVDYEPAGRRRLRGPAVMVDEDGLREAVRLADGWVGRGMPAVGG